MVAQLGFEEEEKRKRIENSIKSLDVFMCFFFNVELFLFRVTNNVQFVTHLFLNCVNAIIHTHTYISCMN